MEDQTHIPSALPVTVKRQTYMPDDSIRPAIGNKVDGLPHIDKAGDRPVRDAVVHRYNDGLFRITIHDPFQTNFLSSHNKQQPSPCIHTRIIVQTKGLDQYQE
jgi:hypothetical protein